MYETLEHWKVYKQEKELQKKIAKEFGLDKLTTKENVVEEFDKWMDKLITKNGVTKY
jgi:hypothetical protein